MQERWESGTSTRSAWFNSGDRGARIGSTGVERRGNLLVAQSEAAATSMGPSMGGSKAGGADPDGSRNFEYYVHYIGCEHFVLLLGGIGSTGILF